MDIWPGVKSQSSVSGRTVGGKFVDGLEYDQEIDTGRVGRV